MRALLKLNSRISELNQLRNGNIAFFVRVFGRAFFYEFHPAVFEKVCRAVLACPVPMGADIFLRDVVLSHKLPNEPNGISLRLFKISVGIDTQLDGD